MATVPTMPTFTVGQTVTAAQLNTIVSGIQFMTSGKPHFFARQQKSTTTMANSTWTDIVFDTEDVDSDYGFTPPNQTYTANTAGWYVVDACVTFSANGTGDRAVRLQVNNASLTGISVSRAASIITGVVLSRLVYLNVGDNLKVQGWQSSTASLATSLNYNSGAAEASFFQVSYYGA